MKSYDATTLASHLMVVFLLRRLQAKGLMLAEEVGDLIDCAMREFEVEGLDDVTMKEGHRLLRHIKEDLAEPGKASVHSISRRAA
jgi:hypothetical protein